ncbi:endopeptidase La [Clostridium sp.]|uniref:endopeptidase La n=1 Tax=Clostridium sp. TaxID=1506 RepID=UPI001A3D5AAA|nr:endopeptidase La [Clostridium sp.]MBK5243030.1 endopeptidase La [Clostridium sp.]
MDKNIKLLPLIPLRGMSIFPYMVLHFDVGREKSTLALEEAMLNNQEVFLVSQKKAKVEEPEEKDIYSIGTVCNIKQILKLPGDTIRVLVEGIKRGKILEYKDMNPFVLAEVEILEDEVYTEDKKCKALLRTIDKLFEEYINLSANNFPDALFSLEETEEPGRYCDIVSSYLILKPSTKQQLLETLVVVKRLEKLLVILKNEVEVLKIEKKIGTKVKTRIDKIQKEYYLREQMKAIQEELGEDDENKREMDQYEIKIKKAKLPKEAKEKAVYELNRLKGSGNYSAESGVIKAYLDWVLALPWNKATKDNIDINKAREVFGAEHYGLMDVKERIIEYLAVKKISKTLKGPILCLVGPPGVGKTSIAKSVANALNRNFVRMSLGGVKDEAEIRGHRKTYVGAIPGRIIYAMKQAGSKNPLFLLDEIDKMSGDAKGDPADALLEVLDSEQNATFRDHYLELDFDLSEVLFITTANKLDTIPRPLLDRMEVIEVSGYTSEEKFHIAKQHLIPKMLKEHNMEEGKINFSNSSITCIIENYTRESGVRNLERQIASVIRKAITEMVEKDIENVNVEIKSVKRYLGAVLYTYDKADKEDAVGVVNGLAWTEYGGVTLLVEVSVMEGTGKLQLTGQLGDVMKESAKAGYSYVRANALKYNIDKDFYKNVDIHIHVPEGAVPKDGPSAGVTMITAMVSALTKQKVRHNVAMTGEITLTGRVLPIGGLKEKSLAAYRAGIDTIIIPKDNEKDIQKIPDSIKDKLKFIIANKVEDVLENALIGEINNGN